MPGTRGARKTSERMGDTFLVRRGDASPSRGESSVCGRAYTTGVTRITHPVNSKCISRAFIQLLSVLPPYTDRVGRTAARILAYAYVRCTGWINPGNYSSGRKSPEATFGIFRNPRVHPIELLFRGILRWLDEAVYHGRHRRIVHRSARNIPGRLCLL